MKKDFPVNCRQRVDHFRQTAVDHRKGVKTGRTVSLASWFILIASLIGVAATDFVLFTTPVPEPSPEILKRALHGAEWFERTSEPMPHYRAFGYAGERAGSVVLTSQVPPSLNGYMGKIHMAVGITNEGVIDGVVPYRHSETPYYFQMVLDSGIIDGFAGVDMSTVYPAFDTVSGATVSSRAIINEAIGAAVEAARSIYGIDVPNSAAQAPPAILTWRVALLAAVLTLSLAVSVKGSSRRPTEVLMAVNLITVGILLNTPITLSAVSRLLTLNLPGLDNPYLLLMLTYALFSILLTGRGYCRLVCPFGILQYFANRCRPWQIKPPPGMTALLPSIRRLFLSTLLVLSIWMGMGGFSETEPFFSLFSFKLTPLLWYFSITIIIISIFWRRFWCNALCPTGTALACLNRLLRPLKGKRDETI